MRLRYLLTGVTRPASTGLSAAHDFEKPGKRGKRRNKKRRRNGKPNTLPGAIGRPPTDPPPLTRGETPAHIRLGEPEASASARLAPAFDGQSLAVYHWSPPERYAYRNFGDELCPLIVGRMLARGGFGEVSIVPAENGRAKLLAVGSVLQHARDGDVVWGAGVNAKVWARNLENHKRLDVRLVRGPLTKSTLTRHGIACPDQFGDPGLIFPLLYKQEIAAAAEQAAGRYYNPQILFIPNLNDDRFTDQEEARTDPRICYLSPSENPFVVAYLISQAELVVSSSLHGLVLADAFSIPSRPVLSWFEPLFKYIDYYRGSGRNSVHFYDRYQDALVGQADVPRTNIDVQAIIDSFPKDILAGFAVPRS
jgi:pyruvyltransferase